MSEEPNLVDIERRDGGVAVVTLDNAATRNALSPEMIRLLGTRLEELMEDNTVRSLVITGANGTFCSGGDVSRMSPDRQILDSRNWLRCTQKIIRAIVKGDKPVVAAVEGAAFGAGMSIAAGCDYVVAADSARFCAAFVKVGLAPDLGLFWTLPQRVGVGQAKKLIMLASVLDAKNAKSLGLVDDVVEKGSALEHALTLAEALAAAAPLSVAVTKAIYADGCHTLEDAFRAERDHQSYLYRSTDHLGAVKAFKEKRTPTFEGK